MATIEATSDQVGLATRLTQELPALKVVLDHFGWPTDLSDARVDAIGTIFGAWTAEQVRPWLLAIVALFGPDRCMLGSDLPIERLRSGFEPLYRTYDEILASHTPRDREC